MQINPDSKTTPIPNSGNQGGMRMWLSEARASWVYDAANSALIVGLIIGAAATILVVWMGNIKEDFLRRELAATNERAAQAHERAAELEKQAAAAKAEQERLKAVLAWRRITQQQFESLSKHLKGRKFEIRVGVTGGHDPESMQYWEDIRKALQLSGLTVIPNAQWSWAVGLSITPNAEDPGREILKAAFAAAGIPLPDSTGPGAAQAEHLEIVVGTKPPPF